jgi:hypothetical protein
MKLNTMRLPAAAFLVVLLATAPALRAISVIPPTFTDLVGNSDAIFSGKVIDQHAEWVVNQAGYRVIKTFVTVRLDEVAKGEVQEKVTLAFFGGTAGGHTMEIGGMPRFRKGQRAWFFVKDNGRVLCPLAYAQHGAYLLVAAPDGSGDRVLRLNGAPLASTEAVGAAEHDHPHQSQILSAMRGDRFGAAISRELLQIETRQANQR